ncbi:MAG: homoserine kinase [Steroidobacteraceae bacterium]
MATQSATAFAPATVGNVAVGFDILGHAFPALGDCVRAERMNHPGVRIASISGIDAEIPTDANRNTAGQAVLSLAESLNLSFGIALTIRKGIPIGSGLGGSAASAVAAVVAANQLLDDPLPFMELLPHAIQGEAVASGSRHADNVAPSLFGGLVLTVGIDHPRIKRIPVPPTLRCVLVHPHFDLATREARAMLRPLVPLSDVVWQSANLAGFLAGCYTNDLELMREAFEDVLIEPQRARLIPGFEDVKQAALAGGALGCSISGGGPSIFAWCEAARADAIGLSMSQAFAASGRPCDRWVSMIDGEGANVLESQ